MTDMPARRPKIVDVARAAGVSPTTVSHALNGRGQVDPRTRQRVVDAAHALGYRPHLGAQRLRTGASRQIALVSSMPFSIAGGPSHLGFFMEVASSAAEFALTRGYALVLVPPLEALPSLDGIDMGGAVVVEPARDDKVIEQLRERNVPVVSIGAQPGAEDDVPYVDMHGRDSCRLILEHLHDTGARRIALVTGAQERDSYLAARQEYRAFARRHHMPQRQVLVDESAGEEGARHKVTELLRRSPEVDAICALVDTFASGAVAAARELGLSVPGDLRLATRYDGLRARTSNPPLTAVNLHLEDVAAKAVELLLQAMTGQDVPASSASEVPTLVPRASSASVTAPAP